LQAVRSRSGRFMGTGAERAENGLQHRPFGSANRGPVVRGCRFHRPLATDGRSSMARAGHVPAPTSRAETVAAPEGPCKLKRTPHSDA